MPKILVVEDFEEFRQFVVSTIRQRGQFKIMEASNGLQALQQAETLQPDLILLDIGLPDLNGLEVARRLRKVAPSAKVLFISQERSPDIVREAFSLGAGGYIQKSRAASDLLRAIEAVLSGKRFVSKGLEVYGGTDAPHEILFCRDEAALLDGLTDFVVTALNAGNAALVVATQSHQSGLLQRLWARGMDIDAAIRSGTYVSLDADEEIEPGQLFEVIGALREAASKAGKEHPRVAACGERAGSLWATGRTDEAIRLEQFCNELAKNHEVELLCVYPSPHDRADAELKTICAEHTAVSFR